SHTPHHIHKRQLDTFSVVHRRPRDVPGDRLDSRRSHRRPSDAGDRRAASRSDRAHALRRRRFALADTAPRRRPPRDGTRRRGDRLGDRRARDRVPATQPDRDAGPGRRRFEHALQRAADDLDRSGRRVDHDHRLPHRDRGHGSRLRRRLGVSPDTPRRPAEHRARARLKEALPLWRNRDFVLLWSGQVVSTLGSEVSGLAFPLLVLSLTGSPAQAGVVGFARALPYLLVYLPAGALVDRWNRKRVMLTADAGRAPAIGSVAMWLAVGLPPVAWLAVASFVEGALFVFFQLAESAALPHIVPKEQLPPAIAQNQARVQARSSQAVRSAASSSAPLACSRSPPMRRRMQCRSSRCFSFDPRSRSL